MLRNLAEAMLYDSLSALLGDRKAAWNAYLSIASLADVSRPLPEIVRTVGEVTGRPAYELTEAWQRSRHFHEAYPFEYTIIKEGDSLFPPGLDGTHFLYAYGEVSLLACNPVTVLGMRGPSDAARSDAVAMLKEIHASRRPVMGTLDTGLDAYAMLYALNERMSQIVVLASPLHQCMPEGQKELMVQIANTSPSKLLLSPFAPSARAEKWFTVPRNELLAALTELLVIVEERNGGPLWRLAASVLARGSRVMLGSSCLSNPAFTQAAAFAEANPVLCYRHHGELKRLLSGRSARKARDDGGQLELF